ncbi:MAG: RDD family protein [Aldersonia sp.]|nr:RDD family protein [Aldersonia sp.]
MARMTGSWLSGPSAGLPPRDGATKDTYRGEGLGLPESGPGSVVGTGRRVLALMIDWLIALGLAALFVGGQGLEGSISTVTLLIWLAIGIGSVSGFGFTPGQYFAGIRVVRIDAPARVGFVRALVRSLLLVFVVPALFTDTDGRGMHDRATGTAVVRGR